MQFDVIGAPVGIDDEVGGDVGARGLDEDMDALGAARPAGGVADDPARGVAGRDRARTGQAFAGLECDIRDLPGCGIDLVERALEGAEKVLEWFGVHHGHADEGARNENKLVWGAIRTDLILSTEIMLISLANLEAGLDIWTTLAILAVIALLMTGVVYGAVALLVKIDDIGLRMAKNPVQRVRHTGTRIVRSMPAVFRFISILGTVAMLWVGGHLLIVNLGEVGIHIGADILHAIEHAFEPAGGFVVWIGDTLFSAVAGLVAGLIIVGIVLGIARLLGRKASFHEGEESPADVHA